MPNTKKENKQIEKLEKEILKNFQKKWDHIEDLSDAKAWHYARNENQASSIEYVDVLLGNFELASNFASALHRLDSPGDLGNERNSKWLRSDGAEYVFKYVGSADEGQFQLVESDKNLGTFNFILPRGPVSARMHENLDVDPWILWGNSAEDAKTWSVLARSEAYSFWGGVKTFLTDDAESSTLWFGGSNNDYVTASVANEVFNGRGGEDIVSYQESDFAVVVSLDDRFGSEGDARGDTFRSIEGLVGSRLGDILIGDENDNILSGGSGADILLGLDGSDTLEGGFGKDTLDGGSGNDSLSGGVGDDTLRGGEGNDFFDGGAGRDYLDGGSENTQEGNPSSADAVGYGSSSLAVTVSLEDGTGIGGDAEGDILVNIENIFGSQNSDDLTGSSDDNLIFGFRGNDVIYGLGGDDYLEGGQGGDFLDGGSGADFLSYSNSSIGVNVNLSTGHASGGEAEGDTFVNFENLNGSLGDDTLTGDDGNNWINGQAGNDILDGLGGADNFFFEIGDGNDTILNFEAGVSGGDTINITLFGFADFNDLIASASDVGVDVEIDLGGTDSLTLVGLQKADLHWGDFFV